MKSEIGPPGSWPLDDLCTYIINKHHKYVYENLPLLLALTEKLVKERDDSTLNKISDVFKRMSRDMLLHMMKEEKILFPFIEQMVEASKESIRISVPFFGTVNNPAQIIQIEHEHSWEDMSLIRTLTNNYNVRENDDPTLASLYKGLEEFEKDLQIHLDLENNILFPKAILVEKRLGLS